MEKLTPQQVERLYDHLVRSSPDNVLFSELFDHLVCEVEHYLWLGLPAETAVDKVLMEASDQAVRQVHEVYRREVIMTETQLQQASLDDIVFQYRNKDYGAYALRQAYPKTLRNALVLSVALFVMVVSLLSGISQGPWSYLSFWGISWIISLCVAALTIANWFLEPHRQKHLSFE